MQEVNNIIKTMLNNKLSEIEKEFDADVFTFCGPIMDGIEKDIKSVIEDLHNDTDSRNRLLVILTTNGGSALAVERIVNIFRGNYKEVFFLVPDHAYSAGTILCMSGDDIYMNYYSALGPIDPQVPNKDGKMVPALGYLDKINELIEKAKNNILTNAEFLILKDFDLAELRLYEQARDLTVDLLKNWLVKYKFKNWEKHKDGSKVTQQQKNVRATEIAKSLGDTGRWKSHGRPIDMNTLINEIKLKIIDYGVDPSKSTLIEQYDDLLKDYMVHNKIQDGPFVHTRIFI